jgi:hypothetical protein
MNEPTKAASKKASRRSQFDAFLAVCDRFSIELIKCGDPQALALAQSWDTAKAKSAKWLENPGSKITRSLLAREMKQGLRETPKILQGLPGQIRHPLMRAFRQILQEEVPHFLSDERDKLARIVKRGRLRNEDEYYLVRHRADEIEGRDAHKEKVAVLLGLLDNYEGTA